MPIRFDDPANAAGDALSVTATVATSGASLSGCCWVKRKVDTNAFATCMYVRVVVDSGEIWLEHDTSGDVVHLFEDPGTESDVSGPTTTIDTWFFLAWSRSNTSRSLYYGTEAGGSLTKATNTDSRTFSHAVSEVWFGQDIYTEGLNGEVAWGRLWDAVLSDADFDAEWRSATPARATNLRGDWRLTDSGSATTDSSGNGFTLTSRGTPTTGGANPVPPSAGMPQGERAVPASMDITALMAY